MFHWWAPATRGREETLLAVRHDGFMAENRFAMAAVIGAHSTVEVAGLVSALITIHRLSGCLFQDSFRKK